MITAIIFLIVIGVGLWIMVFSKESDNAQEDEPSYVQMEGDDEAPLST